MTPIMRVMGAANALMLLAMSLWTMPVRADSWTMPQVESYFSADRRWRLEVRPRPIESPLEYLQDKVDQREPAGAPTGATQTQAQATLQRMQDGKWANVWDGSLLNQVAPVTALVSPHGQWVTFDNWHSVGYGPHAVVIYAADGRPVRAMGLKDFLPRAYIATLERTVSSIWWEGEHRLSADGRRLLLQVRVPVFEKDAGSAPEWHVELEFDLASGQCLPGDTSAWAEALRSVERYDRERRADDGSLPGLAERAAIGTPQPELKRVVSIRHRGRRAAGPDSEAL